MTKKTVAILAGIILSLFMVTYGFCEALTPQLAKAKVIEACRLIEAEGESAFSKIKDPEGEFRFAGGRDISGYRTLTLLF